MCESTVYLDDGTVVMADVMKIVVNGDTLEFYDILNNKKEIKAKFNVLDLEGHKIVVTELYVITSYSIHYTKLYDSCNCQNDVEKG